MKRVDNRVQNILRILVDPTNEVSKKIDIDVIVDFNIRGEAVGIEILNLKYLTSDSILDSIDNAIKNTGLSYSYDDEVDAFYLKLQNDHSSDQYPLIGKLGLDKSGNMTSLEILVEYN